MAAMIDIRVSAALPAHPKYKRVRARLSWVGTTHLFHFLLWVAGNRPDGDLTGMSNEDIELAVDWPGDFGAFASTLADVGFLDGVEGSYLVHDWAEHQPWVANSDARSERGQWGSLCKHYGKAYAAEKMPEYAARLEARNAAAEDSGSATKGKKKPATGNGSAAIGTDQARQTVPVALPNSAGGMPVAEVGSSNSAEGKIKQCPVSVSVSDSVSDIESKPSLAQRAARRGDRFPEFWTEYPRKKGKAAAEKTWAAKKLDDIADQIIADVKARKARDAQWQKEDGRYIPHGSTYLNQRGWEDDIEGASGGGAGLGDSLWGDAR